MCVCISYKSNGAPPFHYGVDIYTFVPFTGRAPDYLGFHPTLRGSGGESFWEEGDDFGVDVLRFHTCLTSILGFLEKLEWWFEQDFDDEGEEDKESEGGSEVLEFDDLNNQKDSITWQSIVWMEEDAKDGLAKQGNDSLRM
nr:hypothetical protein [Tanacetum cinerariifolium]